MKYNTETKEFYSAYSLTMIKKLNELGFEPIDTFTHIKTKMYCEVYKMTDELSEFLSNWSKDKMKN